MKKKVFILLISLGFAEPSLIFCQQGEAKQSQSARQDQIRQGAYAEMLVKGTSEIQYNMRSQMPIVVSQEDCIRLLETNGISPLKGWHANAVLTRGDHTTLMYKLMGREKELYQIAQNVCALTVNKLNIHLSLYYRAKGRYPTFAELKKEKGVSALLDSCPYGALYKMAGKSKKRKIAKHVHLQTSLGFLLLSPEKQTTK